MSFHKYWYLNLLFPTLNHCLNPPYVNIKQLTTSEVAYKETVMAYNEDLDPPLPYDISNEFAAADFSSHSSDDAAKYKPAWIKAKIISSSILSGGECPDACSRALTILLKHR